jgi:3-oxoacyl-[acyl-carrier protein] reductase
MESLKEKTALVTGGSRGIGASIVRRFAEAGTNVAFTYHSSSAAADALAAECSALGVKVRAYKSDASSFEQAGELITEVVKEFTTIDIVVNNAGITKDTLLLRMSEEDWDQVINTNLKSIFNITKHVAKPMLKQRAGSIINMSSIVGVIGQAGQGNYAASKAGIIGFTKSMAKELGSRSIRCNAIAPGFIETEMTDELNEDTKKGYLSQIPLKRMGKAEEVADLVLFLGSDRSKYISGQVISICGALNC